MGHALILLLFLSALFPLPASGLQTAPPAATVVAPSPPRATLLGGLGNSLGWFGIQGEAYFVTGRLSTFAGLGYTPDLEGNDPTGLTGAAGVRGYTGGVRHRAFVELGVPRWPSRWISPCSRMGASVKPVAASMAPAFRSATSTWRSAGSPPWCPREWATSWRIHRCSRRAGSHLSVSGSVTPGAECSRQFSPRRTDAPSGLEWPVESEPGHGGESVSVPHDCPNQIPIRLHQLGPSRQIHPAQEGSVLAEDLISKRRPVVDNGPK